MEDIIDIIVTETTNLIEITSQPTDEIIDVNIIDNREDITLNVTPSLVEININSLTGNFGVNWGEIAGTLSSQTDLQNALNLKADLVDGKVPSSQLPSYVDDIVEVATYSALPVTGEVGKIYVVLDTNLIYRWSGSAYIEIKDSSAVWGAITGTLSSQTDLQNALNAKFNNPTGDSTQYLNGAGTPVTFPIAGQAGTLVREVRNTTGTTLTKGTVVYISGATGNKPTVSKALATGDSTSAQTFGLCQADIANNANGYVVCTGDIVGIDTSAISEGVQLYLSSTTAGTYTTTKQVAPAHLVYIGVVTRSHPTQGQIEVKIQNGYELDEIHDVLITSVANNQGLFYESSTSLWKNKSIATVLGYTPANDSLVVHLAGTETITGAKTFSSSVIAPNFILSGGTGNTGLYFGHTDKVVLANYVVGGGLDFETNGGAITMQLSSAGNLSAVGTITGASIIKSGGTSAQFLKADGSVDSTAYVSGSGIAGRYAIWDSSGVLSDGCISAFNNITYVECLGLNTQNGLEIEGNFGGGSGGLKIKSYDETTGKAFMEFINTSGVFRLGIEGSTGGGILPGSTAYATVLTSGLTAKNLEFGTNNTKRMTISGTSGGVGIGTDSLTQYNLRVSKNITGAVGAFGVVSDGQIQSDVTSFVHLFRSNPSTQATTFALTSLTHYYSTQGTIGAGSSVTNQYGFYTENTLTGATNNYAYFSNLASGTGRWNLYMAGTANNYLNGSLGIGSTTLTNTVLNVSKAITGAITSSSIQSQGTIQSDVTSSAYYYYSGASTAASSFTVNTIHHYAALQGIFGAGSTVIQQHGFYVNPNLIGATNNYGFRGSIPSGTNRWNIYMDGTANNHLAGNLLIGSTADTGEKLQVTGTAKLTGALSGTSATFTTALTAGNGTAAISLVINRGAAGDGGGLRFQTAGTNNWYVGTAATGTSTDLEFYNHNTATSNLRISYSTGNLAIGTSISTNRVEIVGPQNEWTLSTSANTTTGQSYGAIIRGGTNSSDIAFRVNNAANNTTYFTVNGNGMVLIGRTSANSITSSGLQVNDPIVSVASNSGLYTQNRASSNFFGFYGSTNLLVYNSDVGTIGTFAYNTGIYTPTSDKNKKKDFEESNIGLNEVLQLKPTLYRMKTDNSEGIKELGFIAQEVKDYIPNAYVESGDFIGLNFNPIVAALTKAIQELKAELDTLKNK
jgi:hypothetical protein